MKVAIVGATGPTGPTGIHLAGELHKTPAAVRVVARRMDNLARLFPDAAVEKRPADILDADATLRAVEGRGQTFSSVRISIVFGWVVAAVMVPIYNKIASA